MTAVTFDLPCCDTDDIYFFLFFIICAPANRREAAANKLGERVH